MNDIRRQCIDLMGLMPEEGLKESLETIKDLFNFYSTAPINVKELKPEKIIVQITRDITVGEDVGDRNEVKHDNIDST